MANGLPDRCAASTPRRTRAAPALGSKVAMLVPANAAASARIPLAALLREVDRLLEQRPYVRAAGARPAGEDRRHREADDGRHPCRAIAARLRQGDRILGPRALPCSPGHRPQAGRLAEEPGRERLVCRLGVGPAEDAGPGDLDRRDDSRIVVLGHDADGPVGEEGRRHPDRGPRLRLEAPLEGGGEVVDLRVQAVEPVDHHGTARRLLGLDRERTKCGEVAIRDRGRLPGRDELLARVLPDRLEHPVAPRGSRSTITSERSTRRVRPSTRSSVSSPSGSSPTIRAATRTVQPPVNTDSRRSRRRSSLVRRSQLQSMSACSVCWRGTAVRRPPARRRNRSPRRSAMSSGDIAETRAAASSIASGIPSRRRQISTTEATLDGWSVNAGSTDAARSANSCTASVDAASCTSTVGPVDVPARAVDHEGARQGPQLEHGLTRDGECLAARRHDAQARGAREQALGEPSHAVHEVLGVVEQEEQVLVGDEGRHRRDRRARRGSPAHRARARPPMGSATGRRVEPALRATRRRVAVERGGLRPPASAGSCRSRRCR